MRRKQKNIGFFLFCFFFTIKGCIAEDVLYYDTIHNTTTASQSKHGGCRGTVVGAVVDEKLANAMWLERDVNGYVEEMDIFKKSTHPIKH